MTTDTTLITLAKAQELVDISINPGLAAHGGSITLHSFKDGMLYIQMHGGCHGCAMSKMTMRLGVEETMKKHIPEISQVIDVTDHDKGENPYYKE